MEGKISVKIEDVCHRRFCMAGSNDSLRAICGTLQRDTYVWITCGGRVKVDARTANCCENEKRKMTQCLSPTARVGNGRSKNDPMPTLFKYVASA